MTMSSVRVDVQWLPAAPDHFLTWGTDLQLYQVQDATPTEAVQPPREFLWTKWFPWKLILLDYMWLILYFPKTNEKQPGKRKKRLFNA